jgi:type IV secretion system protein VirB6
LSLGEVFFFDTIQDYLVHEAKYLMEEMLGNVYSLLGGILLSILTLWVLIQGYRIMSGQSRESLMSFIMTAGKAVVIVATATAVGSGGANLFTSFTDGISAGATYIVTGDEEAEDPYKTIDKQLKVMQIGLGAIKSLDTGGDEEVVSEKNQALWMSGAGVAGPAVVAGTLLIINKFAMALFIGFAPIFIMCLLFDQTKSLFNKWLQFGIGVMVSMAVLVFMSEISMRMIGALAAVVLAQDFLNINTGTGFTAAAMQQGGLGLVLTALLITIPNMASNLVGQFTSGFYGNGVNFTSGGGTTAAPGSAASGGGGVVTQSAGGGAPSINTGSANTGGMTHGSRHTVPSESSAGHNYNAVRTDSSMGYAAQGGSSGSSSAAVGAGAAYGGLSAASGGYSGSSDVPSSGSSPAPASSSNNTSTVQSNPIGSGGSSASAPSSTAATSPSGTNYSSTAAANAAVAASTSASAPPPAAGGTSSSTVTPTGSVTANAGVNQTDVNSIRQGSQLPTRKG